MDLIKLGYQPVLRRAAKRVIVGRARVRGSPSEGRFTSTEVDGLLRVSWEAYDSAATTLPPQPTRGSAMNVRLACITLAFFDQLLAAGTERAYAIELISDAAWNVYTRWASVAKVVTRIQRRQGTTALAFAQENADGKGHVALRFPFNAPGYRIAAATGPAGGTAFDVVHCPVSSYFREHGAADLCFGTWCNLDYALGEKTNQTLIRTKTLAQGYDHCDFRILPASALTRDRSEPAPVERAAPVM